MSLFKRKSKKVVDWTERLNTQQEQVNNMRSEIVPHVSESNAESPASPFPFFAGNASTPNADESSLEERRKRLGKRLLDMTNKIEDLSNQIYKMQQRIEVLERKSGY